MTTRETEVLVPETGQAGKRAIWELKCRTGIRLGHMMLRFGLIGTRSMGAGQERVG